MIFSQSLIHSLVPQVIDLHSKLVYHRHRLLVESQIEILDNDNFTHLLSLCFHRNNLFCLLLELNYNL